MVFCIEHEMFPEVRIDLMKAALTAFYAAMQANQARKLPWSKDAWNAVFAAVKEDRLNSISYLQRCHAFRIMTKKGLPKTLRNWLRADGSIDDDLINAVAVAPLRRDGIFRIKEFAATAEKIKSDEAVMPLA
jgi:hypothetical protein